MPGAMYDPRDFGARGDGVALDTEALQRTLDACADSGGGQVRLSGGRFRVGTLVLRSGVDLHIESDATLLASTDIADYSTGTFKNMYRDEPHMDRCLIFAADAEDIALTGSGVIDGEGSRANFPNPGDPGRSRPMLVRFLRCSRIRLSGLRLINPAAWTSAFLYCRDIEATDLTITSRANENGDGLDFDGCTGVRVSDCVFDTSDDSICLQASRPDSPCTDVVITRCTMRSRWAGLRIGLLSRGVIDNVRVSDCRMEDIDDSGIKIQMCEGGRIGDLLFEGIEMLRVPRPIFVTISQQRASVEAPPGIPPLGEVHDLTFRHLVADARGFGLDSAIVLSGAPGNRLRDCTIEHVRMSVDGGGAADHAARRVPEFDAETMAGWWPEYSNLAGPPPAYGLFARHCAGLTVRDVGFAATAVDERPPMLLDDVLEPVLVDVPASDAQEHPGPIQQESHSWT